MADQNRGEGSEPIVSLFHFGVWSGWKFGVRGDLVVEGEGNGS